MYIKSYLYVFRTLELLGALAAPRPPVVLLLSSVYQLVCSTFQYTRKPNTKFGPVGGGGGGRGGSDDSVIL